MNDILLTIAVIVIGYILGCFSTGILISRQAGVNIRQAGSKNTGRQQCIAGAGHWPWRTDLSG